MLLALLASLSLATPPQPTLDALGQALGVLEDPARVRSLHVETTVVHSRSDGQDRQEERIVSSVRNTADGREVEVISHHRDGEEVTGDDQEGGRGDGVEVLLPGEASGAYAFGPTRVREGVCTATFEPAPGADRRELATGELAWDQASGTPLWLRFTPEKLSWMVQSLDTRLELSPTPRLHTHRIHSEGQGGVPGLRRVFSMDMTISEVGWVESGRSPGSR